MKPAEGSHVLVAQLGEEWVVLLTSEVEEIQLRGKALGGIIKIEMLTSKVNEAIRKLNENVAELKTKLNAHTHSAITTATIGLGPTVGVITVSAPASGASTSDAAKLSKDDYENTTVKHA